MIMSDDSRRAGKNQVKTNITQHLNNLPKEIFSQPRFFRVAKDKTPLVKQWNNPVNQKLCSDIQGLAGFDTCGHDRAPDYLFLDFDHVLDDDGLFVNHDAEQWYNFCASSDTFCERSISRHGLHFLLRPSPHKFSPASAGKNATLYFGDNAKLEIFFASAGRYCLLTGDLFNCEPQTPIVQGEEADYIFQALLNEIQRRQSEEEKGKKTAPTANNFTDSPDYDSFRAIIMLDAINPVELSDSDWLAVISAAKNIGITYNLVDAFNRRDPDRYNEKENLARWNSLNNPSFTIETLHGIAKRFHYEERDARRQWYDLHPDLNDHFDDLIAQWQINNHGAHVDKKVIADLKAARLFIDDLTPRNFSPDLPFDISVRRKVALCKFYIPQLAQKFFSILKDAQKAAASKIKNSKDQTDITPTLNQLAALKPSEFENAVNEFVTQIKRDQKDFHKRFQEELDRQAFEEKKKAILDSQLSTQKKIPDCPVDLFLPDSVYFDSRGVGTQSFSKRGDIISESAALTPIVPVKILREPHKHFTQYEIAIKAKGFWRHVDVLGDELADSRKILRLAQFGAIIENARALTQFFAKIIAANEDNLVETKCYQQPGWNNDKFIYPTGGDDYIVRRNNIDYEELFDFKGDPDRWKQKFNEIICSNQGNLKRITLGAFCAAPMLKILHIPNFWLHVQGRLNFAKTPLIKFGLSIYGNPAETFLLRSFDSSPKNRVAMAVAFNDLPQAIDELETLSPKEIAELQKSVYDYVSGMDGQKNLRSGDVRPTTRFRGIRISTGERPVLDQNAKGGALKRCITLHVTEPFFDDPAARQLHIFCEKNYGLFGKSWTQYISDHADQISDDFEKVSAAVQERMPESLPPHIRAVAACSVALWHFRLFLNLDSYFDRDLASADSYLALKSLPTQDEISDVKRGIDSLASWVDEHPKNFIHAGDKSGTEISASSFTETSGIIFTDGRVAFFPNAFKRICESDLLLPSYEKFLNELFDDNILICSSRRDKRKSIKGGGKVKKVYMFKPGTLITLDTDALDESFAEVDT